jgi:ribonuclease P protein subunit POP4
MPLTPETLPRHELVGLDAEVVSASNSDLVGIAGEVVTETTKTLGIEGAESGSAEGASGFSPRAQSRSQAGGEARVFHVPKADATFEFELVRGDTVQVVTVEGEKLVARPARRTEQTGDSQWR